MPTTIVTTADRPDLVELTARWRWVAFYAYGVPFTEVHAAAMQTASENRRMPRTFVLLVDGQPAGTASLTDHDLEERPELSPWLAGVFVASHFRGRGYAGQLIDAVEQHAAKEGFHTLWLYTNTAERIYARAGWQTQETVQHGGKPFALMRRDLPR